MKSGPKPKPINDLFFSKVDKNGPKHPYNKSLSNCWTWTGGKNNKGYGIFTNIRTKGSLAHRFSWKINNGDAGKLLVLHSCDFTSCVNPEHLFVGSAKDNTLDMIKKGRLCNGEKRHNAKFNAADVILIREFLKNKIKSRKEIAKLYAVNPSSVRDIEVRATWKHL